MAHFRGEGIDRDLTDSVVEQWREDCLIEDGSLLFDEPVWTAENFEALAEALDNEDKPVERDFLKTRLHELIDDETALTRLSAELVAVQYLFIHQRAHGGPRPARKREVLERILGWGGDALDEQSKLSDAMSTGIASAGTFWAANARTQFAYLVEMGRRLKHLDQQEREALLHGDPWKFMEWLDEQEQSNQPVRQIVLHLLFPDEFERIASSQDKWAIRRAYGPLVKDLPEDVDRALFAIREAIEELLSGEPDETDFYRAPLDVGWNPPREDVQRWTPAEEADEASSRSSGYSDLDALEQRQQVILYGPPGTGKTYSARLLANELITHAALTRWGPVEYLRRRKRIEAIASDQVEHRQLHPGYSYEDFVRGLRIEQGETVPTDGEFLNLVARIENSEDDATAAGDPTPLPWILILDEINRTDLSRLFGEVFSILEDRKAEVTLPIQGEGLRETVQMPADLYVIGTMNLIDVSVEQLDFALRRRFMWLPRGFDRDAIPEVVAELWDQRDCNRRPWLSRYGWDYIAQDIEYLAEHAERLNHEIAHSNALGGQYEIGHTYFFAIAGLLERWRRLQARGNRPSGYLWDHRDEPRAPLLALWRNSLRPLLAEYLSGVETAQRTSELTRLASVFLYGEARD
jgi:5-methylcytosine-specific restriction protein B